MYISHNHATILARETFVHVPYTYGNFLDAFHLYRNIVKSVHYSQYVSKGVSF